MKKSQSSLEFLFMFGMGLTLIVILGSIFFYYSNEAKVDLDKKQIRKFGEDLMSNVEKIYYLGDGNRITQKSLLPDTIFNFTIHHSQNGSGAQFDYLNITTYESEGISVNNIFLTADPTFIRFNCTRCYHDILTNISYYNTSDFAGGSKAIKLESKGDWVTIDFVN